METLSTPPGSPARTCPCGPAQTRVDRDAEVRTRSRAVRPSRACHEIVRRFGYLQLDSIGVTGARTQGLVLMSRLDGLDPSLAEDLLQPGEPLFEYLGHEACWQPMEDWPLFAFRRRELRDAPRWGEFVAEHRDVAAEILRRIETEGPLRSLDFESGRFGGNWQLKIATFVASALWGTGELAIRERRSFQRVYDLAERVIPDQVRSQSMTFDEALPKLVLKALDGHGWARPGTIADTWRLKGRGGAHRGRSRSARGGGRGCRRASWSMSRADAPPGGSGRRISSWRIDWISCGRARIAAFCCRRSIRCCGTASGSRRSSASTRFSRSTNRPKTALRLLLPAGARR